MPASQIDPAPPWAVIGRLYAGYPLQPGCSSIPGHLWHTRGKGWRSTYLVRKPRKSSKIVDFCRFTEVHLIDKYNQAVLRRRKSTKMLYSKILEKTRKISKKICHHSCGSLHMRVKGTEQSPMSHNATSTLIGAHRAQYEGEGCRSETELQPLPLSFCFTR